MERTNSTGLWPWVVAIALIIVGPLLLIEALLDLPNSLTQVVGTVVVSLLVAWTICSFRAARTNQAQALTRTTGSDQSAN